MQNFDPLADLDPAAYAPFRDPRDYILSWTDQIWIDKGLGRLGEHYADDIKVHTAYGETYDFGYVLTNSVQKMSAFPNGGGGSGPALMDDRWIYGGNIENIVQTIREGRPNGMPSFRGKIPDDQIWEIAAYVRSMGRYTPKAAAPGRMDDMHSGPAEQRRPPASMNEGGIVPPSAEMPQ